MTKKNPPSGIEPPDPERVAQLMDVPVDFIAKHDPLVQWHIYLIWARLNRLFDRSEANTRTLLHAPNPHLDNRVPIEFIETGDLRPPPMFPRLRSLNPQGPDPATGRVPSTLQIRSTDGDKAFTSTMTLTAPIDPHSVVRYPRRNGHPGTTSRVHRFGPAPGM